MVDYRLEGRVQVRNLPLPVNGNYPATLDLRTPEMIDLSVTHQLDPRWTLHAGAAWTRWSRLQTIKPVSAFPSAIEEKQHWNDSWAYAFGATLQLNPRLQLRSGIAFDQSPTNNIERSPRIPSGDRVAVSLGTWLAAERADQRRSGLELPARGRYRYRHQQSAQGQLPRHLQEQCPRPGRAVQLPVLSTGPARPQNRLGSGNAISTQAPGRAPPLRNCNSAG